ncbi:sodium:proton antiporter [Pelagicoccus sp. SDUM812003]|uniref:sodium:proton antiporter n=1 Tax=Pelagicoccus sp. SDUM812003 TaxID=3041267 RepID=UPI00280D6646|nr:sodium:proton antiporter [Pelagicoccus sp. SDUM812003]MDQ8205577.1 sodium:proton antiporter [Pelagicoccus sp. SDUM812003]
MTWEILLVFLLLGAMLASFAWEKLPTELTAFAGLAILMATGILSTNDALASFSNSAPITVGAMFILSAALEKSGAIQLLADRLQSIPGLRMRTALPALILCVAAISAFINNTPVVVVFLPVALSLAKQIGAPASKLLIPLSYASIFGGSCTLIGTSTNIVVSSVAANRGLEPISMFELAWIGIPLFLGGSLYLLTIGYKLIPRREMLTSILTEEEKREYILEAFVNDDSALVGKSLSQFPQYKNSGLKALEVIRRGIALPGESSKTLLEAGDRVLVTASARALAKAQSSPTSALDALLAEFGLEQIAAVEGSFVEVALRSETNLAGSTLRELNFRQRYRLAPVAIHRKGRNLRTELYSSPLQAGDILLLLGSKEAIENLRRQGDFVIIDEARIEAKSNPAKLVLTLGAIAGVISVSAIGLMPIAGAAIIACVLLLLTKCISMNDAYRSIHWPILFLIFAMIGVGRAMETSGASDYLAQNLVSSVSQLVSEPWRPIFLLAGIYLLTTTLTEVLSNNAAAVLMTTLAIGTAETLGVDARPFIIAVAMGASASFATPIGYQTNTYVYGIGGYRFSDFLKVGIPLNLLAFIITVIVVPLVWSF